MRTTRVGSAVVICALAVLMGMIEASQPTRAAGPWYVAPGGNDADSCLSPAAPCATINGAIGKATSGDTIYVAAGTYTGMGYEVVLLDRSLVLSGGWNAAFAGQEGVSTIDGADAHRGITVNSGVTATVERFKVFRGGGTGIASGNGIWNSGNLTLNASEVSSSLGGLYTGDRCSLSLNNSSVRANGGPGILINWSSEIILNGSTVEGNTSGIYSHGGYGVTPQIILKNSTVSGNSEEGIALDPFGYSGPSNLYLNNATISDNAGGGFRTWWTGTAISRNSIIARNTPYDCAGDITSAGYNLVGNLSGCTFTPGIGDLTNVDAHLGLLIGAPGTARYHPLLPGGPAIDAGNPAGCTDRQGNPLPTDQRGAARVGRCDIGAYEYTAPAPAGSIYAFGGTPQHAPPSRAFAKPLQAAVLDGFGSPVNNVMVTFSAPTSGPGGTFAGTGTYTTTAMTAETGVATAATFTANGPVGSYTVTATVSGVVTPATFLLSNMSWYVAPGGNDSNTCQSPSQACVTINGALNKLGFIAGDSIRVATGTYTGTGDQVVWLSKNAVLSGGWNGGFTAQVGLSTVDAQGEREGIRVANGVTAAIERFDVRGGSPGIRSESATLTLTSSTVSTTLLV